MQSLLQKIYLIKLTPISLTQTDKSEWVTDFLPESMIIWEALWNLTLAKTYQDITILFFILL